MAAPGVKFIRVNGRVVPVRQKAGESTNDAHRHAVLKDIQKHDPSGRGVGGKGQVMKHSQKPLAFSGAHHGAFAAVGAVTGFLATSRSAHSQAAAGIVGSAAGLANLVNSVQHGRQRGSGFWSGLGHGIGRNITNTVASGVGGAVGGFTRGVRGR